MQKPYFRARVLSVGGLCRKLIATADRSREPVPITLPRVGADYVFREGRLVRDGVALPARGE